MPQKQPPKYKIVVPGQAPIFHDEFRAALRTVTGIRRSGSRPKVYLWNQFLQQYIVQ